MNRRNAVTGRLSTIPFVVTGLAGGVPFLLYWWARLFGELPGSAEWFRLDTAAGVVVTNHGPWYGTWQGTVVFAGMALLTIALPATAAWSLASPPGGRKRRTVIGGLTLIALQATLLAAQANWLSWTID